MRFAIMIEGQQGVTWDDWLALARDCERLGFETLFRSDHYGNDWDAPFLGSLDAWGTICGLAAVTERLRLGTLVSPATFRHPSNLAKLAVTADHISAGRIELGIGTGWMEQEHRAYGFPFPPMRERMDRLAEQLEVIAGSFAPGPFSFSGEHFSVAELDATPKPVQQPFPLLMGGQAAPRGSRLAARFAAEYNVVEATPEEAAALAYVMGEPERDVDAWLASPPDAWIVGTLDEVTERLVALRDAGLSRVMLQHLLHTDLETVELIGRKLAPAVVA